MNKFATILLLTLSLLPISRTAMAQQDYVPTFDHEQHRYL